MLFFSFPFPAFPTRCRFSLSPGLQQAFTEYERGLCGGERLLFIPCQWAIFQRFSTTKCSGLSVWTTSVSLSGFECIAPFVERIADLSVQKARTEAVRRGEKIQFNGFYLTRGHYSFDATFHDANTSKIIFYDNCRNSRADWLIFIVNMRTDT